MTLGVLGGMGPMATVLFLEHIVNFTNAGNDQEHINTIIYNMPSIPSRTDFILNNSNESPLPHLIKYVTALKNLNVSIIAIPCVTAMYFYSQISNLGVEVCNIADIALNDSEKQNNKIGVLATTGTVSSNVFQNLYKGDIILPNTHYQNIIMDIIFNSVKGGYPVNKNKFIEVINHLKEKGSNKIILGCTELSIAKKECNLKDDMLIDALEQLAKHCILRLSLKNGAGRIL